MIMSFDLILSTKLAKLQRNGDQNVPHDFTINFPTPIYLDSEKLSSSIEKYLNELFMVQYRCRL